MYKTFQNPHTGKIVQVKVGYSWTVCFFGIIPMLCRKDWSSAILSFIIATILNSCLDIPLIWTSWIFYDILANYYNSYYASKLLEQGYIELY